MEIDLLPLSAAEHFGPVVNRTADKSLQNFYSVALVVIVLGAAYLYARYKNELRKDRKPGL